MNPLMRSSVDTEHPLAGVSNTTHAGTLATRTRLQSEGLTVASLEKGYAGIFD